MEDASNILILVPDNVIDVNIFFDISKEFPFDSLCSELRNGVREFQFLKSGDISAC